jgi:hypothetical protein
VLAILLTVVAATLAGALRSISTSSGDRSREAALHAADAGLNLALWRTNKLFLSTEAGALLDVQNIQSLGCVSVQVGEPPVLSVNQAAANTWCPATASEDAGNSSTYRYWQKTTATVGTPPVTLTRLVVATGTSRGITRRVLATLTLTLGSNGDPTSLWKESGYVECPSGPSVSPSPGSQNPDAGCPNAGSPTGSPS